MGMVKNFLSDADYLKTSWHVGCQDAALFPPLTFIKENSFGRATMPNEIIYINF